VDVLHLDRAAALTALWERRQLVDYGTLMRVPEIHCLVQRVAKALRLLLAAALVIARNERILLLSPQFLVLQAARMPELRVLLRQARPVPEDRYLREAVEVAGRQTHVTESIKLRVHLGVLDHLTLQRRGNRGQVQPLWIAVRCGQPTKGDHDDWQHAHKVALPSSPSLVVSARFIPELHDLFGADKEVLGQLLPSREHAAVLPELDDSRALHEPHWLLRVL